MVDRSGSADSDSGDGGHLGKLTSALENRLILVMIAAGLGVGGNLAIVSNEPKVRADPFTGTEGRVLESRIDQLEHSQTLDNQHRQDAMEGWRRIRELERKCTVNNERIDSLRRDLDRLK